MKVSSKFFSSQVWENKDAKTWGELAGGGEEVLALQSQFAAVALLELTLPVSARFSGERFTPARVCGPVSARCFIAPKGLTNGLLEI